MKKVYPVIEGKYRFLGGWKEIPPQLTELIVGHGYEITQTGKNDFLIRGAKKLIMVTKKDFEFYFEPYIDYFAEPTIIEESEDARIATSNTTTHETEDNCVVESYSNTENEEEAQLCLF
jgi:hypothetical protein